MFNRLFLFFCTAGLACGVLVSRADEIAYRLYPQDQIRFSIYGEPDLSATVRVSGLGQINLPLLGTVKVGGLTLTESQDLIAKKYRDAEIFIQPQISLQVEQYSVKEVSILGQVGKQGKVQLPDEASSMSIVEALSEAGGLSRIAKGDAVRVTRAGVDGAKDEVFTVNVERFIEGRAKENEIFMVLPGDVIFVPERLF